MSWWVYTDSARAGAGPEPGDPSRPLAVSGVCERCSQPKAAHEWRCQCHGCGKLLCMGDQTPSLHGYKDHRPGMRHSSTALLVCVRSRASLEEARAYLAAQGGLRLPGMGAPAAAPAKAPAPSPRVEAPAPDDELPPAAERGGCPMCRGVLGENDTCRACNAFRLATNTGGSIDIGPSHVTSVRSP